MIGKGRQGFFALLSVIGVFTLKAQVSIKTNLLHTIPLNRALIFDLHIKKPQIRGASNLEVLVPTGLILEEITGEKGIFSFAGGKANIVWEVTPTDSILDLRMKILPTQEKLSGEFIFRYSSGNNETRQVFEATPFLVQVKDTVFPVVMSAPMTVLTDPSAPQERERAIATQAAATELPFELSKQVKQLKKDSKEAFIVGEREKSGAQMKLNEIARKEKELSSITDPAQKTAASEELKREKLKAQEELAVAQRVLTLAKKLERQANEIEKFHVDVKKEDNQKLLASAKSSPPTKSAVSVSTQKSEIITAKGLIYKIQLGVFRENPGTENFSGIEDLSVIKEGELYKVMAGNFTDKEEAYKTKDKISTQLPGCFIVRFQDGVRVK